LKKYNLNELQDKNKNNTNNYPFKSALRFISEMPFARFTVHHNFEVERQFAGREYLTNVSIYLLTQLVSDVWCIGIDVERQFAGRDIAQCLFK
jgi:hypothetical protein